MGLRNLVNRLLGAVGSRNKPTPSAPGSVRSFLEGEFRFVKSSNLVAAQYHQIDRVLSIEYQGGRTYDYYQVSEKEAEGFITAGSHGTWVWDHLRVRGDKRRHKKPFIRVK